MAQQDNIILIRMVPTVTTSILDYFLTVALISEINNDDLQVGAEFSVSGIEEFASLSAVAEKFKTTSQIYYHARDAFNQKVNIGINQSEIKKLIILKKEETDATFEDALNRLGYKNSYYMAINPVQDSDIESADKWVSGYRKILFAQTNSVDVISDAQDDIASVLKAKGSARTALYYHGNNNEKLATAVASILASYPIARKNASFKRPSGITVDKLTDTQEGYLDKKNVNSFIAYIGGAGDCSTRELTSHNGVVANGDEIQQVTAIDRIVLTLQASYMDALEQDIPYDDRGGTVLYGKTSNAFAQLKKEGIFAEDSVDEETGEVVKSYTINVLPIATIKKHYTEYFAQKMFLIEVTATLAGSGKKIMLTFAY